MTRLSLNFALVGALALGASETAAFAADYAVTEPPPRSIARTHWHGARRVAVSRCIEVSQPPRGCPLHHYARLPWPGVPTLYAEETAAYPAYSWHRCWWGEWC
jgi:hypothetical protein